MAQKAKMQQQQQQQPNPIINFQYYGPPVSAPAPPFQKKDTGIPNLAKYPPVYAMTPFNQLQYAQYMQKPQQITPTVINNYQLGSGGILPNASVINYIKQDKLPEKNMAKTSDTISERLINYNFIRSTIFANSDGNNINLDGSGRSLLSYVKFDELNPYNKYRNSFNNYQGLPLNFLIYRSCYPIQKETNNVIYCSKEALSVNIRIYKMTENSYVVGRNKKETFKEFDEWRELAYYEYIRDYIIKPKICPNFVSIMGYFIVEQSYIPFDDVNKLSQATKYIPVQPNSVQMQNPASIQLLNKQPTDKYVDIDKTDLKQILDILPKTSQQQNPQQQNPQQNLQLLKHYSQNINTNPMQYQQQQQQYNSHNYQNPNFQYLQKYYQTQNYTYNTQQNPQKNVDNYRGKALIIISESPTYSLFDWATKIYSSEGIINQMINRGYHSDDEWYNVIFQIISALYVLEISQIYFENMTLENNVYIKDIDLRGLTNKYWKYKIDNVDYYLPNLGLLVMIDSNFNDRNNNLNELSFVEQTNNKEGINKRKINGKCIESISNENVLDYKKKTFKMFKDLINPNVFNGNFLRQGGTSPSSNVITLLSNIHSNTESDTEYSISPYISKYMTMFMNNRIGTYVKELESTFIRKENKVFIKGQIAIYEEGNGENKFVLYLGTDANSMATILTKEDINNADYIQMQVHISSLYNYAKTENILQINNPLIKYDEENKLEEYNIMKN